MSWSTLEDNIKVDHKTIRVRGGLVQDSGDWRVRMNRMMNLQAP